MRTWALVLSAAGLVYACGGDDNDGSGSGGGAGASQGARGGNSSGGASASHGGGGGTNHGGGAGAAGLPGSSGGGEGGSVSSDGGAPPNAGGTTQSTGGSHAAGGSTHGEGGTLQGQAGGGAGGGQAGASASAGEAGAGGAPPTDLPTLIDLGQTHFRDYGLLRIGFAEAVRADSLRIQLSPASPQAWVVSSVSSVDAVTVDVSLNGYHLPIDYQLNITGQLEAGTRFTTTAVVTGLNNGSRVAFVSKQFGSGDIRTWPNAPSAATTGRQAADGVCQAEATAAGFKGTFVALLSSKNATEGQYDAGCRAFGLTGTLPKCGQSTAPVDHAPWLSVAGLPIVEGASGIVADQWLTTIPFHADGTHADTGAQPYSSLCWGGTDIGSVANTNDCAGWTSAASNVYGNCISYPGEYLPQYNTASSDCSKGLKLVCLQVAGSFFGPNTLHRVGGKRAFLSKRTLSGAMSFDSKTGVAAADALCQSDASAANVDNAANFRAYLGTSTDDALCHIIGASGKVSAQCGLASLPSTSWRRLDDFPLQSAAKLAANGSYLTAPMLYAADGTRMATTQTRPWTGTTSSGAAAANCSDWSVTSGNGEAGVPSAINSAWFFFTAPTCSSALPVYCFEH